MIPYNNSFRLDSEPHPREAGPGHSSERNGTEASWASHVGAKRGIFSTQLDR
jgi:hypothetical protein